MRKILLALILCSSFFVNAQYYDPGFTQSLTNQFNQIYEQTVNDLDKKAMAVVHPVTSDGTNFSFIVSIVSGSAVKIVATDEDGYNTTLFKDKHYFYVQPYIVVAYPILPGGSLSIYTGKFLKKKESVPEPGTMAYRVYCKKALDNMEIYGNYFGF